MVSEYISLDNRMYNSIHSVHRAMNGINLTCITAGILDCMDDCSIARVQLNTLIDISAIYSASLNTSLFSQSQKLALEEAEDGSMGLGRAGFRLTVAMPKNNPRILDRRAALSSDNSLEGKVDWQQGRESMRHNWSAPTLEAAEQETLGDVRNSDVLAGQRSHSGRTVLNAKATADDHQGLGVAPL